MKVLTPNEIVRFLDRAKEEGYYELFLLELGTGMRRGEILALKWGDLNLTTGELRINKQITALHGELFISEPKTKASIRTVILPPSLLQILSEYKKTVDSEWIFPSPIDSPGQTVINVGVINLKFGLVRYIIVDNELLIFNGVTALLAVLNRKSDIQSGVDEQVIMHGYCFGYVLSAFPCHQPTLLSVVICSTIFTALRYSS